MLQNLLVKLMMNLPGFLQLKLSKKDQIQMKGRKLLPSIQLLLSFSESADEVNYKSIDAVSFREQYDIPNPMSYYSAKSMKMQTKDHSLDVEDGEILVREYLDNKDSTSSLLYFHGGGFTSGNLESHDALCKYLASLLGKKVFSVDYRRSPEYKFPVPLNDSSRAFDWLVTNSKKFGIEESKICVGGDSAGANLSAALCLKRRDESKSLPMAQLLFYPVTDLRCSTESYMDLASGFLLTANMMRWFGDNYIKNKEDVLNALVSPLLADSLDKIPPSIVVTAGFDPLRDEGFEYAEKLKLNNVNTIYREHEGLIHAFAQFGIIPECRSAIKEACRDLNSIS